MAAPCLIILFGLSYNFVSEAAIQLTIANNTKAEESNAITLVCKVTSITSTVALDNPCSGTEGSCTAPVGGPGVCTSAVQDQTAGTTSLTIPSFSINSHHGCWKCTHGSENDTLCVQGYKIPSSLTPTISSNSSRTFTLSTDCAFPVAKMKWQLVDAPDSSGTVVHELGQQDCTPIDNGTCATFTGCTTVAQNASKYSCSYTVPDSVDGVKGTYYLRGHVVLSGQYDSLLTSSIHTFSTKLTFEGTTTVSPSSELPTTANSTLPSSCSELHCWLWWEIFLFVLGLTIVVTILLVVIILCIRYRKKKQDFDKNNSNNTSLDNSTVKSQYDNSAFDFNGTQNKITDNEKM